MEIELTTVELQSHVAPAPRRPQVKVYTKIIKHNFNELSRLNVRRKVFQLQYINNT